MRRPSPSHLHDQPFLPLQQPQVIQCCSTFVLTLHYIPRQTDFHAKRRSEDHKGGQRYTMRKKRIRRRGKRRVAIAFALSTKVRVDIPGFSFCMKLWPLLPLILSFFPWKRKRDQPVASLSAMVSSSNAILFITPFRNQASVQTDPPAKALLLCSHDEKNNSLWTFLPYSCALILVPRATATSSSHPSAKTLPTNTPL